MSDEKPHECHLRGKYVLNNACAACLAFKCDSDNSVQLAISFSALSHYFQRVYLPNEKKTFFNARYLSLFEGFLSAAYNS